VIDWFKEDAPRDRRQTIEDLSLIVMASLPAILTQKQEQTKRQAACVRCLPFSLRWCL
jgi:hypothetical protein